VEPEPPALPAPGPTTQSPDPGLPVPARPQVHAKLEADAGTERGTRGEEAPPRHDPAPSSGMSPAELQALALRFTEAFNRDDLDSVMSFFADDALYDEFNGRQSRGRAEIRAALLPQFRGVFGRLRFDPEDLFADAAAGKVLIRWTCTLEGKARTRSWRGLDILHVRNGQISSKRTYAKTERPAMEPRDRE